MKINKSVINLKVDSLETALLKKGENVSISNKTIQKLIRLSNTSIGMSKEDAIAIFKNKGTALESKSSYLLKSKLSNVIRNIPSENVRKIYTRWISNCPVSDWGESTLNTALQHESYSPINKKNNDMPVYANYKPVENRDPMLMDGNDTSNIKYIRSMSINKEENHKMKDINSLSFSGFCKEFSSRIGVVVGEGGESFVVEDNTDTKKVIKIFRDDSDIRSIHQQVLAFTTYYGANSAYELAGRAIVMDRIVGTPLSEISCFPLNACEKFIIMVSDMIKKGVPPSDFTESNFLYNMESNDFFPVDLEKYDNDSIDKGGLKYMLDYIEKRSNE
ncbi:MAG: hypothetical protein ACRC0J_14745 [Shewanella oncorhynchi]